MVHEVLDETLITAGGQFLYDKYLMPKIKPYTAHNMMMVAAIPIIVSWFSYGSSKLN